MVSNLIDNMRFFASLRMTELAVIILLQEPQRLMGELPKIRSIVIASLDTLLNWDVYFDSTLGEA